jgi:hypothetical protein
MQLNARRNGPARCDFGPDLSMEILRGHCIGKSWA